MIASLVGVAFALGQAGIPQTLPPSSGGTTQRSSISKAFPRPTGHNGYEEYVQAAEILSSAGIRDLLTWAPGRPRPAKDPDDPDDPGPSKEQLAIYDRLNALTPLEIRRESMLKCGRALDLISRGNSKPVFDPRGDFGPDTLFPEYPAFRNVSRLALQASAVYAADGRTDLATKALLDQIWFADNFGRSVIISSLIATACSSIAIVGFQDILPRLSQSDAVTIEKSIDALMAKPLAVRSVLRGELSFSVKGLDLLASEKGDLSGFFGFGDDDNDDDKEAVAQGKAMAKEFASLSPAARQKLIAGIKARQLARMNEMDRIFLKPEKDWIPEFESLGERDDAQPTTLSDVIASMLTPVYSQYVLAAERQRTQLRLLKLYAQAIQYRWEYSAWPGKLDAIDPMNGLLYIYEVKEDGTIRIASKGTKETGEIDLKYKRPATQEEVKP